MSGVDMSKTIVAKSDQLNSDDLIAGPLTGKILKVFSTGAADQPVAILLDSWPQPYKPCKGMRRVLVDCWGIHGDDYVGRSVTLFRNPDVKYGGIACGGIEISHVTNIDKARSIPITVSKGKKKPFIVEPLRGVVTNLPVNHDAEVTALLVNLGKVADQDGLDSLSSEVKRLWPLIDAPSKSSITKKSNEVKARIAPKPSGLVDPAAFNTLKLRISVTAAKAELVNAILADIDSQVSANTLSQSEAASLVAMIDEKMATI